MKHSDKDIDGSKMIGKSRYKVHKKIKSIHMNFWRNFTIKTSLSRGLFMGLTGSLFLFGHMAFAQQSSNFSGTVPGVKNGGTEKVMSLSTIQHVKINAHDEFLLSGSYYAGAEKSGGVLILHDCVHDSESYVKLGQALSAIGLHVLALDFRGYGASTSKQFSQKKIKSEAGNIDNYQTAFAGLTSYWDADVLKAYHYILKKVDKSKGVSVFSSGCSSSYAVTLAEQIRVNSLVMITPVMYYQDRERYKNLLDIPTYFINSIHHTETYNTSKELFEWNGSKQSKIQVFKSDYHDYGLLKRNKYLKNDISLWIKSQLN
jgi:hypothetical protein